MMATIASHILTLPAWAALLVVFALPALESSAFVGFIFPGEVALILGGVIASQGRVSVVAVLAAAIAGAVVGDSIGYAVGKRYGRRILDSTVGRFVKASHLDRAQTYLAHRGGKAVFFGRFTATLRVLIPGLAGMSGLRYRTFVTYNAASAVGWGTLSVLLGYFGGSNWRHVEQLASRIGLGALGLTAAVIAGAVLLRRIRTRPGTPSGQPPHLPGVPTPDSRPDRSSTMPKTGHLPTTTSRPVHGAKPTTMPRSPEGLATTWRGRRSVVVLPTYNEAENIVTAIDLVLGAAPGVDVLVVDDNSPDGTAGLVTGHPSFAARGPNGARPGAGRVFLLSRTAKDGLGAAYRAGFASALEAGYDAIVQMDADLSHPADRIPALLAALGNADVAVGSRYVAGGGVSNWSWSRRLISCAGNVYVRVVLGLPVHDTTAGFKAFRRQALEDIGAVDSASNGYCFQVENTWRAVRLGLTVAEVPITFTDRTRGTSKMSGSIVTEALTRVLVWRWRELLHGQGSRTAAASSRTLDEPGQRRGRRDVAA